MTKHLNTLLIVAIALLVPSMVMAGASTFGVAKAVAGDNDRVVVPIEVANDVELAALDIPLKFSEGVTLKEVNFENTRVDYFDFKVANIDNENHTVVIGLLPQMTPTPKPHLAAGSGTIANLVFEITDPAVTDVAIEAIELKDPNHKLMFVYHDKDMQIVTEEPKFQNVSVALGGATGNLPAEFALAQNYPNPFNPSTIISFDLPKASDVSLSVYNVLGQKVVTLVDQFMEAGSHTVTFDGASVSSGVYFYRLEAGNFSETKKMMMLK